MYTTALCEQASVQVSERASGQLRATGSATTLYTTALCEQTSVRVSKRGCERASEQTIESHGGAIALYTTALWCYNVSAKSAVCRAMALHTAPDAALSIRGLPLTSKGFELTRADNYGCKERGQLWEALRSARA